MSMARKEQYIPGGDAGREAALERLRENKGENKVRVIKGWTVHPSLLVDTKSNSLEYLLCNKLYLKCLGNLYVQ